MFYKKAQNAIEFMMILIFVFVIVGIIIYFTGYFVVDLKNNQIKKNAKDFAENINNELKILNQVNPGYFRELKVYDVGYKIEINNSFVFVIDKLNQNQTYYYRINRDSNVSLRYELIDGQNVTIIIFKKENPINESFNFLLI